MMKRVWHWQTVLLALAVCFWGQQTAAGQYDQRLETNDAYLFGVYWRNAEVTDYFYLIPATAAGVAVHAVGNVICWPSKALFNAVTGDFSGEAFLPPVDFTYRYFAMPGAYLVGSPFWLLKKVFYDGPVYLFTPSEPETVDPTLEPLQ